LQSKSSLHYFAVCDGHGAFGSEASSFVKQKMPILLEKGDFSIDPYKQLSDVF
jgi:serine/threonine protein phosphatase PrpC